MGVDVLDINVLGPLTATIQGEPIDLGGPRQRAVLADLLVARGNVVPVDRLIDDVWRGSPPAGALGTLQAYISTLRRALEPGRAPRSPAQVVISAAPGYAIRGGVDLIDAWRFEQLVDSTTGPADGVDVAAALRDGLALWRGGAYAEFAAEDWAQAEIARLTELHMIARERLVHALMASGAAAEAVVEGDALVREAPLREDSWRLLALSQYWAARQGDALATLRRAREVLAEELGVDPGPRLIELERAVLDQSVSVPQARLATAVPAGLPASRVIRSDDRTGDEHLWRLPVPATRLIGRDRELAELAMRITERDTRLITVTGPGGTGKTRLCIAAASAARTSFPDGVYFVALHAARTAEVMWTMIGEALGIEPSRLSTPDRGVLTGLAPARALLVLDNLEQIDGADQVIGKLLSQTEHSVVLATSRGALLVAGEAEYALEPLGLPNSEEASAVQASGSGEMFEQLAKLSKPAFAVSADNATVVAELCRRLDGLPLALELAAAQIRVLSPSALLKRLGSRLGEGFTAADRPDRHRSLHAAIAWSFDTLDDNDKQLFASLGVFRGWPDLPAITAVARQASGPQTLEAVSRLARAGLIRVAEGNDGEPRVQLLETIREFARDQLAAAGLVRSTSALHLRWCRNEVDRLGALLGGPDHGMALDSLSNIDNDIRAALEFGFDQPDSESTGAVAPTVALLIAAVSLYWVRHGNVGEARAWLERGLHRWHDDSVATVEILSGLARTHIQQYELDVAAEFVERSLAMSRRIKDRNLEARQLNLLGVVLHDRGRFSDGIAALQQSRQVAMETGHVQWQAYATTNLAIGYIDLGDYETAKTIANDAVQFNLANGFDWLVSINRMNILMATLKADGAQTALAYYAEWAHSILQFRDNDVVISLIEIGGLIAGSLDVPEVAAKAIGLADARRAAIPRTRTALENRRLADLLTQARRGLSPDIWDAYYRTGADLQPEQAIDLVLELSTKAPS